MKFLKASKRLIKAIACLIASVILCAGACLAWFATNGEADANDMGSYVKGTNILSFEVEAFKLTDKKTQTTNGQTTTTYKVGALAGSSNVKMTDYGGLGLTSVTALLLKFTYTFDADLDKKYAIYADCEKTRSDVEEGDTVNGIMHLKCALSSVIDFYDISETTVTTTVTQTTEKQGEAVPDTDGSLITLKDGISDSTLTGTFYCIIDYVEDKIYSQYYKALKIEGSSFNTPMDFLSDIEFYIGESSSL